MKIIYNDIIPFEGYKAINICGIVFARYKLSEIDINHEKIHTALMKEMFYIFFYLWYIIEFIFIFIFNFFKSWNLKYHEISLEEEAYNNEKDPLYLSKRKHYSWLKYVWN